MKLLDMISQLDISTQLKNGKTVLKNCFFTPPFKVANVTEDKKSAELRLMLMSSSPGILDGDDYKIRISLAAETQLHLSTQAFQRIFTMMHGARQNVEIEMQKGSRLRYIPHPSVLHRQAMFDGRTTIFISENSRLIFGDIITSGRVDQDELFQFDHYNAFIDVFLSKKLIFRDNQRIKPSEQNLTTMGLYEGFTHQALLLVCGTDVSLKPLLEKINTALQGYEGIEAAVTLTAHYGVLTRILGTKAEQLFLILNELADLI